MDSVYRVLSFKISTPDVYTILDSQGFRPIGKGELERWDPKQKSMVSITQEEYLTHVQQNIENLTAVRVHFTTDWQAYVLKQGEGRKYILCNTNTSEAVFVADAH
jgi:hypothetical protein